MIQPKVLHAEDNPHLYRIYKIFFESEGIPDVSGVSSCQELLAELPKKAYTHLILDVNLKDGRSLDILPDIRRDYPHLPIVLFTSEQPPDYLQLQQQYGISRYISKDSSGYSDFLLLQFVRNQLPGQGGGGIVSSKKGI